jgi:hypothetical protein
MIRRVIGTNKRGYGREGWRRGDTIPLKASDASVINDF